MAATIILKKGFDIKLRGAANKFIADVPEPDYYALKTVDFPGLNASVNVKAGDRVLAGSPLFNDRDRTGILFTSPVSGNVRELKFDEGGAGVEIIVERAGDDFVDFGITNPANATREHIKKIMLISGTWPVIRQRPFQIIANPADIPKSVFVSGFETAPLAPDYNFITDNSSVSFLKTGFTVLKKLTDGKVNLVLESRSNNSEAFISIPDIEISYFSGPHPAGNAGVHIYHLDRVSKDQVVWFANLQDVLTIGRLFEQGHYNPRKIIALTGSGVLHPQYYKARTGASVSGMLANNLKGESLRCISGNILTGRKIGPDGYCGFYDSQVTVLPEAEYIEIFVSGRSGTGLLSEYRALLSKLFSKRKYRFGESDYGGKRNLVLPGKYDKVLPMDISPTQLIEAILAEDIEGMEKQGIYDIAEEDMALCQFMCPSGTDIRSIVREGINLMIRKKPDKKTDKRENVSVTTLNN